MIDRRRFSVVLGLSLTGALVALGASTSARTDGVQPVAAGCTKGGCCNTAESKGGCCAGEAGCCASDAACCAKGAKGARPETAGLAATAKKAAGEKPGPAACCSKKADDKSAASSCCAGCAICRPKA